mmetsp:Transcript_28854/g.62129  ORF Transcript_28854/g.62129 Transcript_28854/m.62129 type:complete len:277 (-) Transcript_28854:6398-7228(-)
MERTSLSATEVMPARQLSALVRSLSKVMVARVPRSKLYLALALVTKRRARRRLVPGRSETTTSGILEYLVHWQSSILLRHEPSKHWYLRIGSLHEVRAVMQVPAGRHAQSEHCSSPTVQPLYGGQEPAGAQVPLAHFSWPAQALAGISLERKMHLPNAHEPSPQRTAPVGQAARVSQSSGVATHSPSGQRVVLPAGQTAGTLGHSVGARAQTPEDLQNTKPESPHGLAGAAGAAQTVAWHVQPHWNGAEAVQVGLQALMVMPLATVAWVAGVVAKK